MTIKIVSARLNVFLIFRASILLALMSVLGTSALSSQNPNWTAPIGSNFQFSSNVIAVLKLSGVPSNNADDVVAFFDGTSIRGKGNAIALGNGNFIHFVTVYSNQAIDTMTIKVYHKGTDQVYTVQQVFNFRTQSIVGSIDQPSEINIFPGNDGPLHLLPVSPQRQLQGHAFEPIDMQDYLIQPDTFPVAWSFIPNANLNVNFVGSVLHVIGVNGFTGQTQLTIRATELGMMNITTREENHYRSVGAQQAETTIDFNVVPIYAGPLWQPTLPGQGIILGSHFDSVPLHDFENQFTGPALLYDYLPIIEENQPNEPLPNWQVTQNFGTTMSLIAQLDYTPKYQFHHEYDLLAAFVNGEIRGTATRNNINGLFYLSIGGTQYMGDTIALKLYSGAMKKTLTLDSAFLYKPYNIIGNDSAPKIIEFAPIVPTVSDEAVANGMYTMPVNILQTDFVGSVSFTFFAIDTAFPQFLFDETNATFCVVIDSSEFSIFYQDLDGDGLGNPLIFIYNCMQPSGYVSNDDDCNDNNSNNIGFTISTLENSGVQNDGIICASSNVSLSLNQTASAYLWSSGQTTQSIQVNPAMTTIYTVTITLTGGCFAVITDTVFVEGKIVKNSNNVGFNSLRSIIGCIIENDTITYNLPLVQNTMLTADLIIDKNLTIKGTVPLRPFIFVDYNTTTNGILIDANKKLILDNIDIKAINSLNQSVISGTGTLEISGITTIGKQ